MSRRTKMKLANRGGRYAAKHPKRTITIVQKAWWAYRRRFALVRGALIGLGAAIAGIVLLRSRSRKQSYSPSYSSTPPATPAATPAESAGINEGAVSGDIPNIPHAETNGGGNGSPTPADEDTVHEGDALEPDDQTRTPPHGDELEPADSET